MEQEVVRLPLTTEERNDLRKRVLMGQALSIEEARAVIESCLMGAGVAAMTPGKEKRSKKPAFSDEQLDADLAGLGLG